MHCQSWASPRALISPVPVQLTSSVGGHHPIFVRDKTHSTKEPAKVGPVTAVLMYISCKEQGFRTRPTTSGACIYAMTKSIEGVRVIDKSFDYPIPGGSQSRATWKMIYVLKSYK